MSRQRSDSARTRQNSNESAGEVHGSVYPGAMEGYSLSRRNVSGKPRVGSVEIADGEAARVAAYRAAAKVRRYIVANDLGRFATLTCAADPGPETVATWMRRAIRSASVDVGELPYVWVLEYSNRSRTHVHLACGVVFAQAVKTAWPHGYVDITECEGLESQRAVAIYMSKDFEHPLLAHRYYFRRGYMPERIDLAGGSHTEVKAAAEGVVGYGASAVTASRVGLWHFRWEESSDDES